MKYLSIIILICVVSLIIIIFLYLKRHNSKSTPQKTYKIEAYVSSGDKVENVKLKSTEYFFTKEEAIRWAMNFDCTEAGLTDVTTGDHVIVKLNGKKTTTQGWDGRAEWLIEK